MSVRYPLNEYFNRIVIYPEGVLSPSGKKLAYISSLTGAPQVWVGEIHDSGKLMYPKPVTSDSQKRPYLFTKALQWVDEDRLLCLFDMNGDEDTFIELLNLSTGESYALPRGPARTGDFLGFVKNDVIYFSSNRDHPRAKGLYSYSISKKTLTSVYQHPDLSAYWCGSLKYKNYFLFTFFCSVTSQQLHGIDPKTKKLIKFLDADNTAIQAVTVMKDNRILLSTNLDREFSSPAWFHPKTKKLDFLSKDLWDKSAISSPNQRLMVLHENRAGKSILSLHALAGKLGKRKNVRFFENGVIDHISFSKNGKFVLICYSSSAEPRNFYRLNLKNFKIQKLTDNYTSKVPQKSLVEPKLVKYPSQERTIYSWLFLPKGAKKNSSLPVIVWPHGGPQTQERPQPRPIFQYFLSQGFAIWAPNHTGSNGFGKTCAVAIEGAFGTADLPDMENGIEWLAKSSWIDETKIIVFGGSYGGYMTLRSITKLPHLFKLGIDFFGMSNLLTFSRSVPDDWIPYMNRWVGNPETEKEKLIEQSPIFALDQIRCPLMVVQGAKDPRVKKEESDQIVEALRARNHPVEYLVFEDEGHGFFKLENELRAYTAVAAFIQKHL